MKKNRLKKLHFLKIAVLRHGINKNVLLLGLFMLFGLWNFASAQTKSVTLDVKDMPLREVFKLVKTQTGANFIYSEIEIQKASNVTLKFENLPLKTALERIFKDQPYTFEIQGDIVVVKPANQKSVNQEKQKISVIKGKVVGEDGLPIPGVNILLKGTMIGVLSDADGVFKMEVPAMDDIVVVFSFVGMKTQEIAYKGEANLQVVMKDDVTEVDEVVVTGIFKKAKESYTGAVTTITAKDLAMVGNRNVLSSIRNIDPSFNIVDDINMGSDPNRLPNITVRGTASMDVSMRELQTENQDDKISPNLPLFIMDGFEISLQQMMDLDESRVESITLLKDASATAMYGTRGANGVVVITTKRPEAGRLTIYYRGSLNIEAPDLTSYNLMNAREKLMFEKAAGLYTTENASSEQSLIDLYNSRLKEVERGVDTYWLKYPVRTGVGHRHSLSLEGGSEDFRYSVGLGYNNVAGAMKGSERNTFNGNMFFSYQYKQFRFQNDLQVTFNTAKNSPYGSFSEYGQVNSYFKPYDDEGNLLMILEDYVYSSMGTLNSVNLVYNPLWNAYLPSIDEEKYTQIRNNFAMEWTIMPGFVFRGRFSVSKQHDRSDKYISAKHTKYLEYEEKDAPRKGEYTYGTVESLKYDAELTLNYTKLFNDVHQLYAGLSYNVAEDKSEEYRFKAEGIANPTMDFLGMASAYEKDGAPYGNESFARRLGGILNVNYTYDRRYFIDLSGKIDGSSRFGADKRHALFWSAGMGWNLHNEAFMKNNNILNVARLRLSYGSSGSQAFNPYQALTTFKDYGNIYYKGWNGVHMIALGNSDLGWQTTKQLNIGIETELFGGRVRVNADVYHKQTDDLLSDITLPSSAGFDTYKANVGKVVNKGVELVLNAYLIRNTQREILWSVGGTLAHNKNEIKKISNSLDFLNNELMKEENANPSFLYKEGQSMNTIFAVRSMGIDPSNGQEIFVKQDGQLTYDWDAKDKVACGVAEPKIWGNLNTMVRYKDFTLNVIFGYRYGGQQYNSTLVSKVENIYPYYNTDRRALYDRWKTPGESALFKGVQDFSSTKASSRFVMDENTLECRSISLTYDMDEVWCRRHLGLNYLSVAGYMEDVFRLSSMKQERGLAYPFARKFSLSLTARF